MIMEETCPKCGNKIFDEVIATYPPIPRKKCYACGWSWTGEREEIVRVPFKENNKPVPYQEVNPYIGRAATFYKCPKCGAELLYMNNSKFCGECGLELDWSDIV